MEVFAENPFQNSGVTRRLAVLNSRSSSKHPSNCYSITLLLHNFNAPYISQLLVDKSQAHTDPDVRV